MTESTTTEYKRIKAEFFKQPNEVLLLRELRALGIDEDSVWECFHKITNDELAKHKRGKK